MTPDDWKTAYQSLLDSYRWTPAQIGNLTLRQFTEVCAERRKQHSGGGIPLGPGGFAELVDNIRREQGLI